MSLFHPFLQRPHRVFFALSAQVMVSFIVEPLTGLVDTAFVAQLGSTAEAGLGIGVLVPSSVFWIFNFLGIGTQTEVARAHGAGRAAEARHTITQAFGLAAIFGSILLLLGQLLPTQAAALMGAEGGVRTAAADYLSIRMLGAPAVLVMTALFGAMRGEQDMRSPLLIAVGVNVINIALDALLIFGAGPVPAFGIEGAAAASTASQWLGALWALSIVRRRSGWEGRFTFAAARRLLRVGGDLFVRTGLLTAFLLLATRTATKVGEDAAAAHQGIRQVWLFTAFLLDAYAVTGQSLIGFFRGSGEIEHARRVARFTCTWSLVTGVALTLAMLASESFVSRWIVPPEAAASFAQAWWIASLFQPLNSLSFATDGIHWGTGDYRYLRNAMLLATGFGATAVLLVDPAAETALSAIWWITGGWITIRAVFGVLRIWPGIGRAPLGRRYHEDES